jgi:hypothetical protein
MPCGFLSGFQSFFGVLGALLSSTLGLFLLGAKDVEQLTNPLREFLKHGSHALLDLFAYAIDLLRDWEIMVGNDATQVGDCLGDVRIRSLQGLRKLSGGVLKFLQLHEHVVSKGVDASLGIIDLGGGEGGDTVGRLGGALTEDKGQSRRIYTLRKSNLH